MGDVYDLKDDYVAAARAPNDYQDMTEAMEIAGLEAALLEAVRDLWIARCSRIAYRQKPGKYYEASYKSFGVTAAKQRMYALCEELWGSSFDNGPVPSAASGGRDETGWENE